MEAGSLRTHRNSALILLLLQGALLPGAQTTLLVPLSAQNDENHDVLHVFLILSDVPTARLRDHVTIIIID